MILRWRSFLDSKMPHAMRPLWILENQISSFRIARAWALRANFGNGNTCCGSEIDHGLQGTCGIAPSSPCAVIETLRRWFAKPMSYRLIPAGCASLIAWQQRFK